MWQEKGDRSVSVMMSLHSVFGVWVVQRTELTGLSAGPQSRSGLPSREAERRCTSGRLACSSWPWRRQASWTPWRRDRELSGNEQTRRPCWSPALNPLQRQAVSELSVSQDLHSLALAGEVVHTRFDILVVVVNLHVVETCLWVEGGVSLLQFH